jgi:predicted transcriptional regulator
MIMATMTIRLPDEKQKRLSELAKHLGVSINKLIDELATVRLSQFDAEVRFRHLAQKGSVREGLKVLDKLDRAFAKSKDK